MFMIKQNPTEFCDHRKIHHAFEKNSDLNPSFIAVEKGDRYFSYKELNDQAQEVADQLNSPDLATKKVIAVMMDSIPEYLSVVLGILKAGHVFMPININFPPKRIARIIEKSCPALCIVMDSDAYKLDEIFAGSDLFSIDTGKKCGKVSSEILASVSFFSIRWKDNESVSRLMEFSSKTSHEDACYIMSTSGSTGEPKVILGSHKGLYHFVKWEVDAFGLDVKLRCSLLSYNTFDVSLRDIFVPLYSGGTVCIPEKFERNSPDQLFRWLDEKRITQVHIVPTLLRTLYSLDTSGSTPVTQRLKQLERALIAGEPLFGIDILQWRTRINQTTQLVNIYGPSETTLAKLFYIIQEVPAALNETIPIGNPLPDTEILILNDQNKLCKVGETGEIYIKTSYRSLGYLNDPDQETIHFVNNPLTEDANDVIYKTGDLGRYLDSGAIKCEGRKDGQVKLYGNRVELNEIDAVIRQHPDIENAASAVKTDKRGEQRLIGYIVSAEMPSINKLRAFLSERLPGYMIPSMFIKLTELPLTHSNKLDRNRLQEPINERPLLDSDYVAPSSDTELKIAAIWEDILGIKPIGIDDNFFDVGGTSLLSMRLTASIKKELGADFAAVKVFQYPTIRKFSQFIDGSNTDAGKVDDLNRRAQTRKSGIKRRARHGISEVNCGAVAKDNSEKVAIIGMAGRFPGANSVTELWKNLCEGREAITFFTEDQLDPIIPKEDIAHPSYVRARGLLEHADKFDCAFFGMSPREAEMMDPQGRILLETAWETFENAGYNPRKIDCPTGVFVGSGFNSYLINNVATRPDLISAFGPHSVELANSPDYLATRISYKFDLKGPSLSLYTGCSTSLVAVCCAIDSLLSYQCDMALAGGAFIATPLNSGYLYYEGDVTSPDGTVRPFDARANGTVFSNGCGLVLLKRFDDALACGDHIYAVVIGSALNNDGSDKVSFTAPSIESQSRVISMAQAVAEVGPEQIGYVEAHGTGTPVGDPIEIEALTKAFRSITDKKQYCAIGSIKANIGHLDAAAGITGLIKASLSLYNKKLLPQINFESPNPLIDFENSPFFINKSLRNWQTDQPVRYAAVSSFGVGGTNAHVVLEEGPASAQNINAEDWHLIPLSARTDSALAALSDRLAKCFVENTALSLERISHTLQRGRAEFCSRRIVVGNSLADIADSLKALNPKYVVSSNVLPKQRDVVFMFSGQGSQYVGMGKDLYAQYQVFRDTVDHCCGLLTDTLDFDLRDILFPSPDQLEQAEAMIDETCYTQPAIFIIDYALAKLWESHGIVPKAYVGHSIGEYVAACLCGVFSLRDALNIVALRARLMNSCARGSMLAVFLTQSQLQKIMPEKLALAALNSPGNCVVSGESAHIAQFEKLLTDCGIVSRSLRLSHAAHCTMMDPMLEEYVKAVSQITLNKPSASFVSNLTGTWISPDEAKDPEYWGNHLRHTVRFSDCISTLQQGQSKIFLEVGPGNALRTLAMQHQQPQQDHVYLSSVRHSKEPVNDTAFFLKTFGALWVNGQDIKWPVAPFADTQKTPLPSYPFEGRRYWVDPGMLKDYAKGNESGLSDNDASEQSVETEALLPGGVEQAITETATKTIQIWKTMLGYSQVNLNDNFFHLGGNSLMAAHVIARLRTEFNVRLTIADIFKAPTVEELVEVIDARQKQSDSGKKKKTNLDKLVNLIG